MIFMKISNKQQLCENVEKQFNNRNRFIGNAA